MEERPWNKDLSFDDFCELILPYTVSGDQPVRWRRMYAGTLQSPLLDSLYQGSGVLEAALAYQQQCIAGHNHVDIRFSGSSLVEQSPVAVGGKIIYFVVSALGDEVLSV